MYLQNNTTFVPRGPSFPKSRYSNRVVILYSGLVELVDAKKRVDTQLPDGCHWPFGSRISAKIFPI